MNKILTLDSGLGGEQAGHQLKLRLDSDGALTLDLDEELGFWPVDLQAFRGW